MSSRPRTARAVAIRAAAPCSGDRRVIVDGLDVVRDSRRCPCRAAVLVCRGVVPCCRGCRCRALIVARRCTWWRWQRRARGLGARP